MSSEISARTTGPWGTIGYAYDEAGNRLKKTAGSTTSYGYDCMNRLTSATGMGFDWDENGNLVYMHDGSDAWNYTHDPEDRLLSVKKNSVLQNWFSYDADGRRVRIADGQSTLFHVYSGLDIVYEKEGATTTKHYYANGLHVAGNRGGTVEYFHQDHLWSTRLKTDSTGGAIYDVNYVPFGPAHGESGSEEFKYTGKHEDSSGLYYFGARYYDPETGRFITEDLVMGSLDDPQSLNNYVYCKNNPHKYVDPDGKLAIQIGYGGSAGYLVSGFCVSQGIVISLDWSGIEFGVYTETGTGSFFGGGAGMSPQITITPSARRIKAIEGESFAIRGGGALGLKGGGGVSYPIEDFSLDISKPSYSIDLPWLSFGLEAKISAHATHTKVIKIQLSDIMSFVSSEREQTVMTHVVNEALFTNSQQISEWDYYDMYRGE